MVDPLEPVEEVSATKRKKDPYAGFPIPLEIPSPWAGSLISADHQIKIFSLLSNPDHELNEATLENKRIEIEEQTERAKEDERALHHRILEDQLPPKNSLKRRVDLIPKGK